jgi:hypothetical protein
VAQYVLLLHRDRNRSPELSRAEMMEVIRRYSAWGDSLRQRGKLIGSEKLAPGRGWSVRLQDGRPLLTDGPYAETKDVIGGYYLIEAENDAEAQAIAKDCPHLWSTNWVELRPVDRTAVAEAREEAARRDVDFQPAPSSTG